MNLEIKQQRKHVVHAHLDILRASSFFDGLGYGQIAASLELAASHLEDATRFINRSVALMGDTNEHDT